ncbi:MAG TPA: DUF3617 domain-containing protein [Candidatus Acidoferrum sp.]|nr:DUF3617 domain-containing protein [Candidatus Acidoferrum sp.]
MRTKILLVVLFGAGMVAVAAQKIEPLNVKLGLWEMTSVTKNSGDLPIPAEFASQLTPEQKAKLEAAMKAQSAGPAKTLTYKSCFTREKMENSSFFNDKKECTQTILTSTGTKIALKATCTMQDIKMSGNGEFEALSTESIKGTIHMTSTGGEHTMTTDATFTGKWIGASCGDVK